MCGLSLLSLTGTRKQQRQASETHSGALGQKRFAIAKQGTVQLLGSVVLLLAIQHLLVAKPHRAELVFMKFKTKDFVRRMIAQLGSFVQPTLARSGFASPKEAQVMDSPRTTLEAVSFFAPRTPTVAPDFIWTELPSGIMNAVSRQTIQGWAMLAFGLLAQVAIRYATAQATTTRLTPA
jgi:hypothetical protein